MEPLRSNFAQKLLIGRCKRKCRIKDGVLPLHQLRKTLEEAGLGGSCREEGQCSHLVTNRAF